MRDELAVGRNLGGWLINLRVAPFDRAQGLSLMDLVDAAACNMARVPRAIVGGARAQTKAGVRG
jgi:hypothetical protein